MRNIYSFILLSALMIGSVSFASNGEDAKSEAENKNCCSEKLQDSLGQERPPHAVAALAESTTSEEKPKDNGEGKAEK